MKSTQFLLASALGSMVVAAPAFAQDNDESDSNVIIVTASKREQTLQEVPIAVSVTTAATIEQAEIRDLLDLQTLVPSLRVSQLQSSANTNFVIRGFGNGANNAGIEPSVGVFIDGVYRSRSAAQIGDLPNVQRIEVLRGPQSTLFGKNASAGVISVITQKPQFQFGGSVSASYGNYNAVVVKADVTGPITENIAFGLSGNYNRRDGYAQDLKLNTDVNDRNRYGGRADLLIEPSNDFSIRFIADYDKIDENCCIAGNVLNGPTGAIINALAGGVGLDANDPFSYDVYNNFLSSNKIENYGFSGQLDYNFGPLALTSITAYRRVDAVTNQDSDFTGADLVGRKFDDVGIKTFTQELRLASDFDGSINFLLGGYYFKEKINQRNEFLYGTQFRPYGNALIQGATGGALNVNLLETTFGALEGNPAKYVGSFFRSGDGLREAYKLDDEAFSIFGTVDFEITDRLTVTGGFNYTKDKKKFATNVTSNDVFSGVNFNAPQYAPFRQALLIGAGVPPATAAFLAANPTFNAQANPLNGLKPLQFLPPFLNLPNAVEDGRTNDSDLAWSVRAAYEVTDSVNVYATYATGFKASSVNLSRDSRPTAADIPALTSAGLLVPNIATGSRFASPETSEVYEVGLKAQFDQVAFNIAVFKQSIDGFQSNVFTGTGFALANAGKQSTFGIEFDGSVTPVKPLTLFVAMTYLDPKYDSFINSAFGDLSGTTPSGIPGISASMGATYTHEFAGGSKLIARGDYLFESSVNLADGYTGFPVGFVDSLQREVNQVNAALIFQHTSGFELSVYGRNLTNAKYLTTTFPSVAQNGSVSGYPNQPRTYGVTGRFKF